MGIKGLRHYLRSRHITGIQERLEPGTLLIVDGFAWLYFVLRGYVPFQKQYGGDYLALDALIRHSVQELTEQGLRLLVVFDGKHSPKSKDAVKEGRRADKGDQWYSIYESTLLGGYHDPTLNQDNLVIPALTTVQLMYTLQACGIPLQFCEGEADAEIAMLCQSLPSSMIYSLDSDFLLMKDVGYIEMGTIAFNGRESYAEVWRRQCIAEELGMTENQFIEFAILIGNDFTSSFSREMFFDNHDDCDVFLPPDDSSNYELLHQFIVAQGTDFRLSAGTNADLEAAIHFSRAFYDLDPSVVALVAASEKKVLSNKVINGIDGNGHSDVEVSSSLDSPYILSQEECRTFEAWQTLLKSSGDDIRLSSPVDVSHYVLRFLNICCCSDSTSGCSDDDATAMTPTTIHDTTMNVFKGITRVHIRALEDMMSLLPERNARYRMDQLQSLATQLSNNLDHEVGNKNGVHISSSSHGGMSNWRVHAGRVDAFPYPLEWNNVLAANCYQLLCRSLLFRGRKRDLRLSNAACMYDGRIFHALVANQGPENQLVRSELLLSSGGSLPVTRHTIGSTTGTIIADTNIADSSTADTSTAGISTSGTTIDGVIKKNPATIPTASPTATPVDTPATASASAKAITAVATIGVTANAVRATPSATKASLRSLLPVATTIRDNKATPSNKISSMSSKVASVGTTETRIEEGTGEVTTTGQVGVVTSEALPIDAFREEILSRISNDRVTIIHGETGCGKSSRLPLFLLENSEKSGVACRMMISQPRRIAASSLMKRLRSMPNVGDKVGLRMGHGVRDESEGTVISFVTTGYLVRLVAHAPKVFKHHTHLIIDEVHERSIDGDLLCLLARRLLVQFPHLKLVLMSATMHTELYKTYFDQHTREIQCLSVGARRFPVTIRYLEDVLLESQQSLAPLPSTLTRSVNSLIQTTKGENGTQKSDVPRELAETQYDLTVWLIRNIGRLGKAILIFVSGMHDIEKLYDKLGGVARLKLYCIHSDIAFEEQEEALSPAGPDEVKVVIATNAAESSITLPDVDDVICLGTHKALRYDPSSHRVSLVNTWISKASATQRAGRTGRVRPGNVYRIYSKSLYEKFQEHEESEVLRRTLQDVLLRLWVMLETSEGFEGVQPVLSELPEPPDLANTHKSFHALHQSGMITVPSNDGGLTCLGRFAGTLPVDMQLGQLISYGIALGVGTEAVIMAAALSQPQPAFRRASPVVHSDPDELNAIVRTSFLSAVQLDGGAYSEPIMGINLFRKWLSMAGNGKKQHAWACKAGLSHARVHQFVSSAQSLIRTTNEALRYAAGGVDKSAIVVGEDISHSHDENNSNGHSHHHVKAEKEENAVISTDTFLANTNAPLSPSVLNRLRLILVWTCEGNILCKPKLPHNVSKRELCTAKIKAPQVTHTQITSILPTMKPVNLGLRDVVKEMDTTISWHLQSGGRRIYDARVGQKRSASSIEFLLKDLYSAAAHGVPSMSEERVSLYANEIDGTISSPVAPVLWFVQQPQRTSHHNPATIAIEESNDNDGTLVIIAIPVEPDLNRSVYFRIIQSIFADKMTNVGEFETEPEETTEEEEEEEEEEVEKDGVVVSGSSMNVESTSSTATVQQQQRQRMVMFQIPHVSKREQLLLNKLHDTFPITVSMLLPTLGNAKVAACNCLPTSAQLKRIFFGDRVQEHLYADLESQLIEVEESKGLRRIAEQVIGSQQAIVFTDNTNGNDPHDRALLDDLPIGMRVIDSCRLAYKDNNLRVWKDPEQITPQSSTASTSGRKGMMGMGNLNNRGNGGSNNDDVVVVDMKTPMSSWQTVPNVMMVQHSNIPSSEEEDGNHSSQGHNNDTSKSAIMPKHSVPAVACHRGPQSLYSVCFGSLIVGGVKKSKIVVCRGVTVCPPGWQWLFLSLLCLGIDTTCILFREGKSYGSINDMTAMALRAEFDESEIQALLTSAELIRALPNRPRLGRDDALIRALDKAFVRWSTSN